MSFISYLLIKLSNAGMAVCNCFLNSMGLIMFVDV